MIKNSQIRPGDAVFAHTRNVYGAVIRFGQALRWWKYRSWNHMAIVSKIDANGQIWVIQMARRCEEIKLEDVAPKGRLKFISPPEEVSRLKAVEYANKHIGTKYGVLTIVSIAVNLALPKQIVFDIHSAGTLVCSALVAKAWEHGNWDCPVESGQITPAEFDCFFAGSGIELDHGN
jgi:hypothetical protein